MKTIKFFMIALMCMMVSTVCRADGRMIPAEQLPPAAKAFLQQHFNGNNVLYAEIDREFGKKQYEARLNDGTEVKFDKKGNWDKVDCQRNPVPAVLIPEFITNYVNANFPGTFVVKIDKERYGYQIELSNDLELKFNKKGMLFEMDD